MLNETRDAIHHVVFGASLAHMTYITPKKLFPYSKSILTFDTNPRQA
jgi:hypothetical protein